MLPNRLIPNRLETSPRGLVIGLQIAAKPSDEEAIDAAPQACESATEWHRRRPMPG
jgi:Asp-tRNA(Asn)/Glu-tRNA(Gln) amidotransferase A subunit family amidase